MTKSDSRALEPREDPRGNRSQTQSSALTTRRDKCAKTLRRRDVYEIDGRAVGVADARFAGIRGSGRGR